MSDDLDGDGDEIYELQNTWTYNENNQNLSRIQLDGLNNEITYSEYHEYDEEGKRTQDRYYGGSETDYNSFVLDTYTYNDDGSYQVQRQQDTDGDGEFEDLILSRYDQASNFLGFSADFGNNSMIETQMEGTFCGQEE